MRILFCANQCRYIGGAETYLANLTASLSASNLVYDLHKLSGNPSEDFNNLVIKIKQFEPQIIHFNKIIPFNAQQTNKLKVLGIKLVLTVHDVFSVPFPISFRNRIKSIVQRYNWCADQYVIPSQHYFNILEANNIANITHIPYWISPQDWPYNHHINDRKQLLFVGRMDRQKGIFLLLEAFKNLSQKHDDISLTYIGDGNDTAKLVQIIKDLDLSEKVTLLGFKSTEELRSYYHNATMLILPTLTHEVFGLVGIEAQACGLPVIASDLGGTKEWCIDGVTGLAFKNNNIEDLISKIELFLTQPELRLSIKTQAQTHLKEHFSPAETFRQLIQFYQNIIHEIQPKIAPSIQESSTKNLRTIFDISPS